MISIIIPTFNRAHILGETLNSIKCQTYTDWECIVVDDGSSDDTKTFMQSYCALDKRFKYFRRPENRLKGPNSCRNFGFEQSIGDFVIFFDSDDIFQIDAFQNYLYGFLKNIDIVVSGVKKFTNTIDQVIGFNKIHSKDLIKDYLIGNVNFYTEGPMWRKSFLLKQNNLFDEKIRNLDDWDFILRMLYERPIIHFLEEFYIFHRVHENSLSQELNKNNILEIKSAFEARYKHLKILKENKVVDANILKDFIFVQYKRFFKQALRKRDLKLFVFLFDSYIKNFSFN